MVNNTSKLNLVGHSGLKFSVCTSIKLDTRKQVIDQTKKERLILIDLKKIDSDDVVTT